MIRFGLCCIFRDEPIKFGTTTAAALSRLPPEGARIRLSLLCRQNADSLLRALRYCAAHGIGAFRINSQILPLATHPVFGYQLADLPDGPEIVGLYQKCGAVAAAANLRTSFHPDQFVVLNSQRPEVVTSSLAELEYQSEVAEWVGADVVNIHAGGLFGDKVRALGDFARSLGRLSPRARSRLTVENDDKLFAPADLWSMCRAEGLPLCYDVHHHRCHPDDWPVEEATERARETWNREPLFHISSPLEGWSGPKPQRHHDFIDAADFPNCWRTLDLTVDVEAKAKEVAVQKLANDLKAMK